MECLECLSKGGLGPFHHHYLDHFQSCITNLREGTVHGLVMGGLTEVQQVGSVAGQVLGAMGEITASSNAWMASSNTSSKSENS